MFITYMRNHLWRADAGGVGREKRRKGQDCKMHERAVKSKLRSGACRRKVPPRRSGKRTGAPSIGCRTPTHTNVKSGQTYSLIRGEGQIRVAPSLIIAHVFFPVCWIYIGPRRDSLTSPRPPVTIPGAVRLSESLAGLLCES